MPSTIFRRLDLSADHQDINARHNELMLKIEAVVEMDNTDSLSHSSTAEVISLEHSVSGRDQLLEKVSSSTLGQEEIPAAPRSEDGHDAVVSKYGVDEYECGVPSATNGKAKADVSRTAPITRISPESTGSGTGAGTTSSITIKESTIYALEALQQPTLEEERPKEKTSTTKRLATHTNTDDDDSHENHTGPGGNATTFLRPRRGRILSLDRGRGGSSDPYAFSEDDGHMSQESISARTDGGRVGGLHRSALSHADRPYHSDVGGNRRSKSHHLYHSPRSNDDESSSDDESSYFATDLPSPKSGSFSLSSAASASRPTRTCAFLLQKQGSDASLSFSDESDEGENSHHEHQTNHHPTTAAEPPNLGSAATIATPAPDGVLSSAIVRPNRTVADMHLYPQRLTRMHSVSSLVSSESSDGNDSSSQLEEGSQGSRARSSTAGSMTSMSTSGGPELSSLEVSVGGDVRPSSHISDASGRRSPVMGHHADGDSYTPSSFGGNVRSSPSGEPQQQPHHGPQLFHRDSIQRSPPAIEQGLVTPSDMLVHPKPHLPMTNVQMLTLAATNSCRDTVTPGTGDIGPYVGSSNVASQQLLGVVDPSALPSGINQPHLGGFRNVSEQTPSSPSGSMVLKYSEDEDVFEGYYSSVPGPATAGQQATIGTAGGKPEFRQRPTGNGGGTSVKDPLDGLGGKNGFFGRPQRNEPSLPGSDRIANAAATGIKDDEVGEADTTDEGLGGDNLVETNVGRQVFKVYWQRWIMLMYMSALNLLSDWTCYSVAPISLLTEEAFGSIDPERLVVIFLAANTFATACEPIILARLGLRRTVLFGALLLMIGSIVKSGGLPPIIQPNMEFGHAVWRLYIGFFIVGLSQPLYQCTPALLSASWFPEKERTMATGVALNANQVGIGFAFIFGTLLVASADDIPGYFGLLSQISTVVFIGTLIQFDDAPPTPPSSSARAMRGDLSFRRIRSMVRNVGDRLVFATSAAEGAEAEAPSPAGNPAAEKKQQDSQRVESSEIRKPEPSSIKRHGSSTRRRATVPRSQTANTADGMSAPSSAHYGSTSDALSDIERVKAETASTHAFAQAPSPAVPGRVSNPATDAGPPSRDEEGMADQQGLISTGETLLAPGPVGFPSPGMALTVPYGYGYPPPYNYPYYDPRIQQQYLQQWQQQQAMYQQQYYQQLQPQMGPLPALPMPYYPPPHMGMSPSYQQFPGGLQDFDPSYDMYSSRPCEEGAEPIVTITPHHLDIDIRDDQVIRSLHACMIRPGFSHALAAFTVSGIVINTLSTYMDYLVRLNGAPRSYTGIVGGTFQFVTMIASLIVGKQTDKTRAYYSVTIALLVLGAFSLAECGVSLDSGRGGDLRWTLIIVAAMVGPLQPVSTELGVEVAYPLSENTVLVIQQLFSNLFSAIFIPFFKALKDVGSTQIQEDGEVVERPDYTFSFYLLIVLHTGVTVYFATFNGKYLRYEHELQEEADADREDAEAAQHAAADQLDPAVFHPFYPNFVPPSSGIGMPNPELQPLMQNTIV